MGIVKQRSNNHLTLLKANGPETEATSASAEVCPLTLYVYSLAARPCIITDILVSVHRLAGVVHKTMQ
jgi:hypothetical protein